MCTTGPALGRAGRPGHVRTPRQAFRPRAESDLELTPLAYHGKRATGQPMARLSRRHRGCRACGLIHPLCQAHPRRKPRQPAATSWTVRPAGRRPGSSESGVGPLPPVSTLTYPDRCPPITHQHSPAALQLPCELPVSTDAFLQLSKPAPRQVVTSDTRLGKRPPDIAPIRVRTVIGRA